MTGFPLASIRVFWWSHYYKYGMSNNPAYQELKEALIQRDVEDTQGIMCILPPTQIPGGICSEEECNRWLTIQNYPAEKRILNYTAHQGRRALGRSLDMTIQINGEVFTQAGYLQLTHLTQDSLPFSQDSQPFNLDLEQSQHPLDEEDANPGSLEEIPGDLTQRIMNNPHLCPTPSSQRTNPSTQMEEANNGRINNPMWHYYKATKKCLGKAPMKMKRATLSAGA